MISLFGTLFAILRRFWPYLAGLGCLALLVVGFRLYVAHIASEARAQQKAADMLAVEHAQAEAREADLQHAAEVKAATDQAKREANAALEPQLADARARLAVYVARLRDQPKTAASGGGDANLPAAAGSAGLADRADPIPELAGDLDHCTEAVTRLANVKAWWAQVEKAPR